MKKNFKELKQEVETLRADNYELIKTKDDLQRKIQFMPEEIEKSKAVGAKETVDKISSLVIKIASNELSTEDLQKQSEFEIVEENGNIYLVTGCCPQCKKSIAKKVENRHEGAIFAAVLSAIGKKPSRDMVCFNCYEKHFNEETILKI